MGAANSGKTSDTLPAVSYYSYGVLAILLLITVGVSLVFYQTSTILAGEPGTRWTPVVFLIGLCVSLLIFGMTHREAAARFSLQKKTQVLLAVQKENRALLEAKQISRIDAEQANLAKDEFLAIVSHELRTPLNAIAGWNRILKTHGSLEAIRETAVEKIDKNLRLQASIVDELLNFSDVMSSPPTSINGFINIRDIFEAAVATVSDSALEKGVNLASDDELDEEQVLGDRERLRLAMVNVLSNAVKFTPPGGSVKARAFRSDDLIKCVIIDDGEGIPSEFLPHIFEQYKQSEHASTRHYGGLGLGLTVASHIIELHHGTIEAESTGPGGGSKFTISLPVRE